MGTRRRLNIIVDAIYEGARDMKAAVNDMRDIDRVAADGEFSLGGLAKAGGVAAVSLAGIGFAAKQAYEVIGEGAGLLAAEEKFGNLAGSIDTTADVLLGKMTRATNGMVSQAQLISSGTDIISLGLANSEDGVVRLASAVGALNLDMGILALTLANDSTARLDSLGLSLEDVTAKKKELIASGFIGDAFDEAVLIALEEKMTLLGDASQTTAGQMAIVEAQMADMRSEAAKLAATSAAPAIASWSSWLQAQNKLSDGIDAGVISAREFNKITAESETIEEGRARAIGVVNMRLEEQVSGISTAERTIIAYYQGMAELADQTSGFTIEQLYANDAIDASNEAIKQGIRITAQNAAATIEDARAREEATTAAEKQRDAIQAVRDAQAQAEATMGDYFTQALNADDALISFNRTVQTSGGLTSTQAENLSDLEREQSRIIGTISSLQGGTAGLGLSSDQLNEKLTEQYEALSLVEGAMAPLAGITADVVGVSEGFRVNQEAVNDSLYAAADAAGASGTELALLGIATGQLSDEQAEAALKSAALQEKISQLGGAIADGLDPAEAIANLQTFQDDLANRDFSVMLGVDVEESTDKARVKTDETFEDFSSKAEEVTENAKTFFSDFSEQSIIKMDDFGVSVDDIAADFFNATTEAGKLKDMIIMGIPDEKIVKIKIVTEGSIPSGLGGGNTSATTTGVSQDIGH